MIFLVKDNYSAAKDNAIAEHVIDIHVESKAATAAGGLDSSVLKQYIAFARAYVPPFLPGLEGLSFLFILEHVVWSVFDRPGLEMTMTLLF